MKSSSGVLGWFSSRVFLGPAQRRLARQGTIVYAYHKIARPPANTRDPFLYVEPHTFDSQLAALPAAGLKSAGLDSLFYTSNDPQPKAVITFDDGCANVFQNALEPLARHRFRAIQFLVAGMIGGRNEWDVTKGDAPEQLMDEAQVRDWLQAGHEIGSHSMTHRNLKRLTEAALREEIKASRKLLEDRFGVEIKHFCYPYGAWNQAALDIVQQAGYSTACTVQFGVNKPNTPPFQLRRIVPLTGAELLAKLRHRLRR